MFRPKTLLFLLLLMPFISVAQEEEGDTVKLIDYRKQYKVYYSTAAASQNPDSVFALDLSKKKLSEIPEAVFGYKNLLYLNLSKNKFKVLSAGIGKLKSLEYLDLSQNDLKELPPEIGQLVNLKVLDLNRNVIEKLPAEIGLLSNLLELEMWDNELDSIPEEIRQLHQLRKFELRGILFEKEEQERIQNLLPDTKIYFSPPCDCAIKW